MKPLRECMDKGIGGGKVVGAKGRVVFEECEKVDGGDQGRSHDVDGQDTAQLIRSARALTKDVVKIRIVT